jgi:sporulation protein YqfC
MNWREDIAERFELPAETAGIVKLTVTGRRRLLVENHRGVLEYTRDRIEIGGGDVRIRVNGDGLELSAMDRDALLITGTLVALELE